MVNETPRGQLRPLQRGRDLAVARAVPAAPATAVAILFIPVFDTLRVFAIRIGHGRSPFAPDKNHLHHRLLALSLPQIMVVTLMLMINLGIIIITILFAEWGNTVLLTTQVVLALSISLLLELIDRREPRVYAKA
ncbi:MAG: hypothetical protein KY428_10495 [Bacteroidetes bacterium]|nr:hypothetical protein [Bacteroidota bacterium]